jgi:hypothetical protein
MRRAAIDTARRPSAALRGPAKPYLAIVLAVCAACSKPAPATIDAAVDAATASDGGDAASSTPELQILYRSRDGMAVSGAPDAPVPLTLPPQGGFVLLAGARVKHFDLASVMLTASLRDTIDDHVVSVEQRPVMLVAGADGWASPDQPMTLFNWANLPTCPAASATRDLDAQPYVLRIAIADGSGATAEQKLEIVPTCEAGANGDLCRCQCKRGYKLGDPCP